MRRIVFAYSAAGVAPRGAGLLGHALASAPSGRAGRPQPQREGSQVARHGVGARRLPVEKAV